MQFVLKINSNLMSFRKILQANSLTLRGIFRTSRNLQCNLLVLGVIFDNSLLPHCPVMFTYIHLIKSDEIYAYNIRSFVLINLKTRKCPTVKVN